MKKYILLLAIAITLLFIGCSKEEESIDEQATAKAPRTEVSKNNPKDDSSEQKEIEDVLNTLLEDDKTKIADEKAILKDLEASTQFDLFEQENIKEVVIQKRQTDEEQRLDKVWCNVTTEKDDVAYKKSVELVYGLYDEQGWLLDEVSVNKSKEWIVTPLKGVNYEAVSETLQLLLGNGITPNEKVDFSIESQETDLEAGQDKVTVNITIDSVREQTVGQMNLEYLFSNTKWSIYAYESNGEFITTSKAETELKLTEEDLMNALDNQTFSYSTLDTSGKSMVIVYGSLEDYQQDIIINSEELSDFVIESQETRQNGFIRIYHCTGILANTNVTLTLKVYFEYHYEETEWVLKNTIISGEVVR